MTQTQYCQSHINWGCTNSHRSWLEF